MQEKAGNASKKSVKQVNAAGKKAPTKSDSNKKSTKTSKKKAPQDDNMDYSELRDAIDCKRRVFISRRGASDHHEKFRYVV